jgi:hypothetical protein
MLTIRILTSLILATFVSASHAQQPVISDASVRDHNEERATIVSLLEMRGVFFVPNIFGIAAPVSHENLLNSALLAAVDRNRHVDVEAMLKEAMRFDREFRQRLQGRLAAIDAELPNPATQAPGTAGSQPSTSSSIFSDLGTGVGSDALSQGSTYDAFLEAQASGPGSSAGVVDGPGGIILRGQPLCTFKVELIITAGTEQLDRDHDSPSFGRSVLRVPISAEEGFQVQLHHPAAGVVRLMGREARRALVEKGYLVADRDGWRGTPA